MKEKKTGDLCQELMEQPNLDSYLSGNETYFQNENPAAFLAALYDKIKISKAELARRAGMSEVYLHQVFAGRRNPSRDRLLCLCVGMELTLEETQEATVCFTPSTGGTRLSPTAWFTTRHWTQSMTRSTQQTKKHFFNV